jgi:uncharacterized protein (TIGR03437 family)
LAPRRTPAIAFFVLALAATCLGQQDSRRPGGLRPDWRKIGSSIADLGLASGAGGPVDRVWFSEDGGSVFLRVRDGRVFQSSDQENWKPRVDVETPPEEDPAVNLAVSMPESTGRIFRARSSPSQLYGIGRDVYRSDDGGRHWSNLTRFRRESVIGEGLTDLAVSPRDPREIVAANSQGIWRSADGGMSWSGMNDTLPNLPVARLLTLPEGSRGTRVVIDGAGAAEWAPGEKEAWRLVDEPSIRQEEELLRAAGSRVSADVTAIAPGRLYSYLGARDGRIWVSLDQGRTWTLTRPPGGGTVRGIYVDPEESRLALAVLGPASAETSSPRILRTVNGGVFWDDIGGGLPEGAVNAVTADRQAGAAYAATDRGVYLTFVDLTAAGPASPWIPVGENLPAVPAMDVALDTPGNQLFVALRGYGVFSAPAPHRYRDIRIVNAADYSSRPAAPGTLLSVLGARLLRAQAGYVDAPVLHASALESQIQIPFELDGQSAQLSLEGSGGRYSLNFPLRKVAPAIFVDRDGTPMLIDGDGGTLLDAMNPARSNGRVQILATGLGRVRPSWPTGMAAPLEDVPRVVAPVRVYIDRSPVEVTRASLAPGYVGFYLVEIRLPSIVNSGPAELYVEAGGEESNRVRIYLEP